MQLPSFVSNRAFVRNAVYLSILLAPVSLNFVNPERGSGFNYFNFTFNLTFLFAAWVEHVQVLNRFLDSRKWAFALLGSVGSVGVFIGTRYLLEQQFSAWVVGVTNYNNDGLTASYYVLDNLYYALTAVAVGVLFKLIEDWFRLQQERRALVGEKTTAELAFLKSQINPHFLFNTLNNIYALAYAKSDAAPGAILKLSELMRYMLYENAGNGSASNGTPQKVALSKEIQYLRNLVDLEKLRVPNAQVQFEVEGNTDLYRIEPMLLISFVENAFKHGDLTDPNQPLVIHLSIRQGKLLADVLNKKSERQKDATGGIGLPNVRRRLDLLYPNQYTLRVEETEQTYGCRLEISL